MRVNSIRNNQIGIPQFKAQMSKDDINFVLKEMKEGDFYNPYEKIPKLYTILEYAKKCPGEKLKFKFYPYEGDMAVKLLLDDKLLRDSRYKKDAYCLLYDSYIIDGPDYHVTTHARMPKSVFDQKWFIDNRNVTEQDVLSLAYDA